VASEQPQVVSQIEEVMRTARTDSQDYPISGAATGA